MLTRRLSTDWDMTFGLGLANFANDSEAVAQNVKSRLQLLRGEWMLDTDAGVPYLQSIAVKPANIPLSESLIKQTILGTDGVLEITSFSTALDRDTRRLNVIGTITTIYGDITNIKVNLA